LQLIKSFSIIVFVFVVLYRISMEYQNSINIFTGFILLMAVGLVFSFYYLRNLRQQAQIEWKKLRRMVSIRLDLVPLLCENVTTLGIVRPELLAELIQLRGESWEIRECTGAKVNKELLISQKIHEIWVALGKFRQVQLVALQKEMAEVAQKIEQEEESYNLKVRKYNQIYRIIPFRFFFQIFRFQTMSVFEFEA